MTTSNPAPYSARGRFSALNPDRRFLLEHVGFDKTITRASGHYYYDDRGTRYLDFLAQYGAVPFGHNPPELWNEIHAHGDTCQPSFVQPLTSPAAEDLAKRLVSVAPGAMRYACFVNSGAEAVEAGIKLARARTQRRWIISTVRGYHGKTLGALSATDNPAYREPFLVDTTCFGRVAFDDLDALEQRLRQSDVAAFIVEPVQGEGGMRVPSPGYLPGAAALCRKYGTLFVLDEVQTGLGRTGTLFAADAYPGLAPDIILLSKALGGGLVPLGAMLCTEAAWSEEFGFYHSSTFANSHFTCAVGCKVLDMLLADSQAVVRNARAMGNYLEAGLDRIVRAYPDVFQSRTGCGLMQGLVLEPWDGHGSYFTAHASHLGYAVALLAGYLLNTHHIVTAPVFNQSATLRLEPSLTISQPEVDRLLDALGHAGRLISAGHFSELLGFVTGSRSTPAVHAPHPHVAAVRAAPHRRPQAYERCLGKFAFLIHPTDDDVLFDTLPAQFAWLEPERKASFKAWMDSWFERMYEPAPVFHLPAIQSRAGGYAEGWLIAAPLTPARMMRLRKAEKAALMDAYLAVAKQLDVDITGMGAFTSVICRAGADLHDPPVNVTSGNSLTAVASAEGLRLAAAARGRDLSTQIVGVIGAAGSVGRLAALHLGRFAERLILFGNPSNPRSLEGLAHVAAEIYRVAAEIAVVRADPGLPATLRELLGATCLQSLLHAIPQSEGLRFMHEIECRVAAAGLSVPLITLSADLARHLGQAGVVLTASGAGRSFIAPSLLARDCIVCDVARPLDVMATVQSERPDVFAYEGGIMKLPEHVAFGAQNVLGYPPGYNLACLSETIVLAMDGAKRHYSIGNNIDYWEALSIYQKSIKHGFAPAVLHDGIAVGAAQPRRLTAPASEELLQQVAV